MTAIAFNLREARPHPAPAMPDRRMLVEWRVLAISITLSLYSFGYGGLTSFTALYAEANGVGPRSLFFTVLALVTLACRPLSVPLADRIGHTRVFLPSLGLIAMGELLLALGGTRAHLLTSALLFGVGFATAYPVFIAIVMKHVPPWRRGAAFGSVLAAFDTGIGTGSMATGWLIHHLGFRPAFGVGAALAALSAPYFLLVGRRLLAREP
jgi:MFS family permease